MSLYNAEFKISAFIKGIAHLTGSFSLHSEMCSILYNAVHSSGVGGGILAGGRSPQPSVALFVPLRKNML